MIRGKRNVKGPQGDRFIPNRVRSHPYQRYQNDVPTRAVDEVDILTQNSTDKKSREYHKLLESVWNMAPLSDCIFRFTTGANNSNKNHKKMNSQPNSWQVKPRQKSLISTPERVLDLPDFPGDFYMDLMDWGATGYIAVALRNSIFLWNSMTHNTSSLTAFPIGFGSAVNWSPRGDWLAVGTSVSGVDIWSLGKCTIRNKNVCQCAKQHTTCVVNSIAWHPKSTAVISGCSRGIINVFHFNHLLDTANHQWWTAHLGRIAMIKMSPDGRRFASSGEDGIVLIWSWPALYHVMRINAYIPCRAMAWHPWQTSHLAIGAASISVWNVDNKTQVAKHNPEHRCITNCLAFSKLTGELVASIWISQNRINGTKILVLSSLGTVVDWLKVNPSERMYYLIWSSDGKRLATAGASENLVLWKFLGKNEAEVKKFLDNGKKPSSLDLNRSANHGFCIR